MPQKVREVGKTGVEAELRRVAHEADWCAPKFKSPANRSVPDRICLKGIDDACAYVKVLLYSITGQWFSGPDVEEHTREIVRRVVEFAECKAPGKKPTKKQKMKHEMFLKLGINTVIIDSKEAAREYVRGN